MLGNLSSVYSETGRSSEALATAQEALKDAQQEHDTAGVVYCLSELADLYQQQGDLEGALRTFHQGLVWVSELGYAPLVEAEIQKDLGGLYVQMGNWEQASLALRRCIELDARQNDPVSLQARGLLAIAMQHAGRLQEALQEDTAAVEIARQAQLKQQEADLLLKWAGIASRPGPPDSGRDGYSRGVGARIAAGFSPAAGGNGDRVRGCAIQDRCRSSSGVLPQGTGPGPGER